MGLDVNGISLHWETSGHGEPLLWLHGGMGCSDDWRFIFHQAPEGFQVIAPRPPWSRRGGTERVHLPSGSELMCSGCCGTRHVGQMMAVGLSSSGDMAGPPAHRNRDRAGNQSTRWSW